MPMGLIAMNMAMVIGGVAMALIVVIYYRGQYSSWGAFVFFVVSNFKDMFLKVNFIV